ncbi:hypothetical protein HK405_002448 [Cladochytrium tenue]|nr:hypothetical protein HK405_002448 [Cladochytrium tenue]
MDGTSSPGSAAAVIATAAPEELKRLVAEVLARRGVLARIRADLRASVFDALRDADTTAAAAPAAGRDASGPPALRGPSGEACCGEKLEIRRVCAGGDMRSDGGQLALALIADALETAGLGHTLAVFRAEASIENAPLPSRQELRSTLGVGGGDAAPAARSTILLELLDKVTGGNDRNGTSSLSKAPIAFVLNGAVPPAVQEVDLPASSESELHTSDRTISRSTSSDGLSSTVDFIEDAILAP